MASRRPTSRDWRTPGVVGIGSASLLADAGHEVPTALLPSFLTATLGVIEGLADGLAGVARLAGGAVADDPVRRRASAVGGYTATAVLSGLIGAAGSALQVGILRAAARTARGLRVPARNALLAGAVPAHAGTDARTGSSERWTTSAPSSAQCSPWAWSPSLASVPPSSSPSCPDCRPPVPSSTPSAASPPRHHPSSARATAPAPRSGQPRPTTGAWHRPVRDRQRRRDPPDPARHRTDHPQPWRPNGHHYRAGAVRRLQRRRAVRRSGCWPPSRPLATSPPAALPDDPALTGGRVRHAAVSRRQRPFPSSQRWGMVQRDPVGESGPAHTDQFPSAAAGSGDEREVLGAPRCPRPPEGAALLAFEDPTAQPWVGRKDETPGWVLAPGVPRPYVPSCGTRSSLRALRHR